MSFALYINKMITGTQKSTCNLSVMGHVHWLKVPPIFILVISRFLDEFGSESETKIILGSVT